MRKPRRTRKRKSSKGTLIKGMTKRVPSGILEHPLIEPALKQIMKGYSGIYVLYRGAEIYYVGLTEDLFRRLNAHRRDRHRKKWDHFAIFRIKRAGFLKDVETLLTRVVRPRGNRSMGHLGRGGDLTKVLKRAFAAQKRRMGQLERAF